MTDPGCTCPVCTTYRWPVFAHKALWWVCLISLVTGLLGSALSWLELIPNREATFTAFWTFGFCLWPYYGWLGAWIRYRVLLAVGDAANRAGLSVREFLTEAEADASRPDGAAS